MWADFFVPAGGLSKVPAEGMFSVAAAVSAVSAMSAMSAMSAVPSVSVKHTLRPITIFNKP